MDLFDEIDDLSDLFFSERNSKVDSVVGENEDLQSKYSSLHENYTRETENSKKVEKCLLKCLKIYSKLCKKYEDQQKLIKNLEGMIKEKIRKLEEAQKNEEKLMGLLQVYRTERKLYAGQTCTQLRKDKELLLGICCKLITESVDSSIIRNSAQLIMRKYKNDLNNEKMSLLRLRTIKLKDESEFTGFESMKTDFMDLKKETEIKPEDKFNSVSAKAEVEEPKEDKKNDQLDLSFNSVVSEESDCIDHEYSNGVSDKEAFVEAEQSGSGDVSSLPCLEEIPGTLQLSEKCQDDASVVDSLDRQECDSDTSECRKTPAVIVTHSESIIQSSPQAPSVSNEKEPTVAVVNDPPKFPTQPEGNSGSIFDVSDLVLKSSNLETEETEQESKTVEPEGFSGISFETEVKSGVQKKGKNNVEIINSKEESSFDHDVELLKIFREMTSVRLLSPIRECPNLLISSKTCTVTLNVEKNEEKAKLSVKRNLDAGVDSNISKKLRTDDEKTSCNLLDSIMSAMSNQNEQFKAKVVPEKEVEVSSETPSVSASPSKRTLTRKASSKENFLSVRQSLRRKEADQRMIEKLVMNEIRSFLSSSISSKEDADRNVKNCLSVLSNKSEDVIAKSIVAIVFENVDEPVEIFERPSPPLTKTQHRLIVLLSVFRTLDSKYQNITNKILSIISEKLLPDNFFWPDDCIEAASRFYAALCRAANDPKTLWRFCLQVMTDMRQRCPLLMLTVLKTWPDVLHDASTLKNNMLAVTIVNIFLHMPKKEGLRNLNQGRKLTALKHLLLNFYQFKVEDTIEGYAKKVLDSLFREELGSEKSIVLLSKCRDQSWTVKNILPILMSKLVEWSEGSVIDSVASRVLSVIKKIFPVLQEDSAKLKNIGLCLSKILTSGKKNHDSEVRIIEVLLQLKQFPEVRRVVREWIPKNPIDDGLRDELIKASAENILRDLKLNRRKEAKFSNVKKKSKKQLKKKKKKLKGRKLQRNEGKGKSVGNSS